MRCRIRPGEDRLPKRLTSLGLFRPRHDYRCRCRVEWSSHPPSSAIGSDTRCRLYQGTSSTALTLLSTTTWSGVPGKWTSATFTVASGATPILPCYAGSRHQWYCLSRLQRVGSSLRMPPIGASAKSSASRLALVSPLQLCGLPTALGLQDRSTWVAQQGRHRCQFVPEPASFALAGMASLPWRSSAAANKRT